MTLAGIRLYKAKILQLLRLFVVVGGLSSAYAIVSVPFLAAPAHASINQTMNFQGKVVNTNGTNVTDGTYTFVFKIYDAGTLVWTETDSLSTTSGIFQVQLGAVTALTSVNFNDPALTLGMSFNGDPEMSPRMSLATVATAFNAQNLNGLASSAFDQTAANNTNTGSFDIQNTSTTAEVIQKASAGTVLFQADTTNGVVGVGAAPVSSGQTLQVNGAIYASQGALLGTGTYAGRLTVQTAFASDPGVAVRGVSGQTADLFQLSDSGGNAIGGFSATGQLYLGRASTTVGQINLFGSGSANSIALKAPTAPSSGLTLTLPNETGTLCSTGSVCAGYAPAGSGSYIQNGTSLQSSANFNISGAGIIGTNLTVGGDLQNGNTNTVNLTRTLPTTVNNEVDLGSFTFSNGGGDLRIDVTAPNPGFSVAKEYDVPVQYGSTGWVQVQPLSNTGAYSSQDFALDINVSSGTTSLRLRRTAGSAAGTAYVTINQQGVAADTFTASTATSSVTAPTSFYGATPLTQVSGNVGIQNAAPGNELSVNALTTADSLAVAAISTGVATNKGLVVQGVASQSADLLQLQNSSATTLLNVTAGGNLNLAATSSTGGQITQGGALLIHTAGGVTNFFGGTSAGNLAVTGTNDTGIGNNVLQSLTSGAQNTAVGQSALLSVATGSFNTAVGQGALQNNTNSANTAIGTSSLNLNSTGFSNTAIGTQALNTNTSGGNNTAVGNLALASNITGGNNTALGYGADVQASNLQNATAVGTYAVVNQSDSLVLGCVSGVNSCTANTNVGIDNATPSRTLDVNGSIGGNEDNETYSDTTTITHTDATTALVYNILDTTPNGTNSTFTSTVNLTGLPAVDGTFAFFTITAAKGTTSGTSPHSVILKINGTQAAGVNVQSPNGTGASNNAHSFTLVRIGGVWTGVGTGVAIAFAPGAQTTTVINADFAEWVPYSGATQPEPGDVLAVGDTDTSVKDSTTPYGRSLLGVVSTSPYEVGGVDDGHSVIIALTGRVPVKVSLENGPIKAGDPLTSSSTLGVAMKATQPGDIIGTALSGYDGTESDAVVTVQLHTGYNNPAPAGQLQGDQSISGDLNVSGDAKVSGNLSVGGSITAKDLQVTGSSSLADLTVKGAATLQSLTVSGGTTVGTLVVAGTTSVQGDLGVGGHFVTGGAAPLATPAPAAGTAATCAVTGNDTSGQVTITTGTAAWAAGAQCSIAFTKLFASAPHPVIVAANDTDVSVVKPYVGADATYMTINFITADTARHTYQFNYFNAQ